jgi:hypothetical protein
VAYDHGVAAEEAENENTPLAGGFWLVKLQVPVVGAKPLPKIVPVPLTAMNPLTLGRVMEDAVRSNVKLPTLQRAGCRLELKVQGAVIVT